MEFENLCKTAIMLKDTATALRILYEMTVDVCNFFGRRRRDEETRLRKDLEKLKARTGNRRR
jgi:hypothetical protein